MPYKIRKLPHSRLYKVYSHGRAHSHKGLTYDTARRQQIAMIISEKRKSGEYIPRKSSKKSLKRKSSKKSSKKTSRKSKCSRAKCSLRK